MTTRQIFWPASAFNYIVSIRQPHRLAVGAIDLNLERQVRCESHRLRWIYAVELISNNERCHTTALVCVENSERHGSSRQAIKVELRVTGLT